MDEEVVNKNNIISTNKENNTPKIFEEITKTILKDFKQKEERIIEKKITKDLKDNCKINGREMETEEEN